MFISCMATLHFRMGIKGHIQPQMQGECAHKTPLTTMNTSNCFLSVLYLQQGVIPGVLGYWGIYCPDAKLKFSYPHCIHKNTFS